MAGVLILHTLGTDAGKCRRMASEKYSRRADVEVHQVKFEVARETVETGSGKVTRTFKGRYRLADATTGFLSDQSGRDIDTLIWIGHGAAGLLSHEGGRIGLRDIVTMITLLRPRVVNILACNFGTLSAKTLGGDSAGGPYQCQDALRWVAEQVAVNITAGHKLVINASTSGAMFPLSASVWFSENTLDRHLIVENGSVTEAASYEVHRLL